MRAFFREFAAGRVYEDPLSGLRVPLVEQWVKPLYSNETLDKHIHELVATVLFYHAIFCVSWVCVPLVFPAAFRGIKQKVRIDFHIHVVSMVQSLLILVAIIPLLSDPYLLENRVYGYTPYSGLVCTMALGYFIWDSIVSLYYVRYFGVSFLLHGLVSATVYYIGIQPFILYYSAVFIVFEVSTPFLNLRWLGIRFPNCFSDTFNLVNNAILILIFFFVRVCYGWYQTYRLTTDFISESQDDRFKLHYALIILAGNYILNFLNFYWFYRMFKVAYAIISDMITGDNKNDDAKKDI